MHQHLPSLIAGERNSTLDEMIKGNQQFTLASILFLIGAAVIIIGIFLFPAGSTLCSAGSCVITIPILRNLSLTIGSAFALLGFVCVYVGVRKKFTTMHP